MASIITVLQLSIFKLSGLNLFNFSLFGLFFCLITLILNFWKDPNSDRHFMKNLTFKTLAVGWVVAHLASLDLLDFRLG